MPQPYLRRAIIAVALSSYFATPIPSGAFAVNTSPHALHRSLSSSYAIAASGAMPVTRTRTDGGCTYSFPRSHSGQRSPAFRDSSATFTFFAPV